ncbi:response regulator transcription factor [Anaerolineales bacterium HSG6]|nr:response regulator transcription factor [Anaerolineales bacterium HSG6]MDM8530999.1 response regulator transcription factor [Anaerolineales bacterium HSG25]
MENNSNAIMITEDNKLILVVEDDETLLQTLAYNLKQEGYRVLTASTGPDGLEAGRTESPDLIVLDVMLPDLDGLSVCRILRRQTDIPIIMLTARSGEVDKIIGLDSGADDYITKPFGFGEFLARVRAALRRRVSNAPSNQLVSLDLLVDLIGRKVYKKGNLLNLSFKEFDLLVELMRHKGAVLSRDLLLTKVWGYDYYGESRTVDVHIRWLREKIEENPSKPTRIVTIRRIGYRFEE